MSEVCSGEQTFAQLRTGFRPIIGTGRRGGGVMWWWKSIYIYLSLHCHHYQNDFCVKMGSDESHFNVSAGSDGQSDKTVSTNHNLFEEK